MFVGKNGRVRNMRVVQSIVGLDQAALEAVRLWIFKPARFRGTVIAAWVQTAGEFP